MKTTGFHFCLLSCIAISLSGAASGQQYLITTVAGGGGPRVAAVAANIAIPETSDGDGWSRIVAADAFGNAYIATTNAVYKVDPSGFLTRVAGMPGEHGYSGDGGPADEALLNLTLNLEFPNVSAVGLAVDAAGNLFIVDTGNRSVRKVAVDGIISTVAGGPASSLQLEGPIAVDTSGNLFVATGVPAANTFDPGSAVQKIGRDGSITIVAGNGTCRNVNVGDDIGDGGPATAASFGCNFALGGLAVDRNGALYIADNGNNEVRKVAADGTITSVLGPKPLYDIAFDYSGLLAVDGNDNLYVSTVFAVYKITPDGAILTTTLPQAFGIATDRTGDIYLAISAFLSTPQVLKVAADGTSTVVAGNGMTLQDGGPATDGQIKPNNVTLDASGSIYIADGFNNRVRKIAVDGTITTVAGNGTAGFSGDGGPATSAQLSNPAAVAVGPNGTVYISDGNGVIRKVTPDGMISTIVGQDNFGTTSGGLALDTEGNLFFVLSSFSDFSIIRKIAVDGTITTVAGNGTRGFSGDGGPATAAALEIFPGIAVDSKGNLYIADGFNDRVRKVTTDGIITTIAGNGTCCNPGDGGPATQAVLSDALGVAVDGNGNLFIIDQSRIREVGTNGIISTVAGGGLTVGAAADGGSANKASLVFPYAIAANAKGDVIFVDSGDGSVVRELVPAPKLPLLRAAVTPNASFYVAGAGASFSLTVNNAPLAGSSSGMVTVTPQLTPDVTFVSASGTGWTCAASCTRTDALAPGASYPPITLTVDVSTAPGPQITVQATVWGGGSPTSTGTSVSFVYDASTPAAPSLTSPANGANGVSSTPTLTWTPAHNTYYDVYFGTPSNPPLVASVAGPAYNPFILENGKTYHWKVIARNPTGSAESAISSFTTSAAETTQAPIFHPKAGVYQWTQVIQITDATPGAVIYYTLDGTAPTASSPIYSSPITIGWDGTIKAFAVAPGASASSVVAATYTIDRPLPAPTFSLAPGTYTAPQTLTLSDDPSYCANAYCVIYYTFDGSTPTTNSNRYLGPLHLTAKGTVTFKAFGTSPHFLPSPVVSATYTTH